MKERQIEAVSKAVGGKKHYRLAPFLSPFGAWAYGIGAAIGWGSLVVTTNSYLLKAGPLGSVLGILVGAAVMVVIARNYGYMMNRYPDSGGSYTYVRHVLGPDFGFLLAWFLVLAYAAVFWANATSLPLFSRYFLGGFFRFGYLYTLFGYEVYAGEVLLTMVAIAAIGVLCTRDKRHKQVIVIALALIFTAAISICFVGALALPAGSGGSMDPALLPDKSVIAQIFAVGLMTPWAYIGFESISHSTEEFAFPHTKSFRILLTVIATTTLLYVFITLLSTTAYPERYDSWLAYLSDLGNCEGIEGLPPFYAAYSHMGTFGVNILVISLLALVLSSLITLTVAVSRLFVALARDNLVPEAFSNLNSMGTPQNAVLFFSGISLLIPFLGRTPIGWIVDITTISACVVYGLVSFAEYRIGRAERLASKIATGGFGLGSMVVFGGATLLPSLFSEGSLAAETYLLVTAWAILGFLYFRLILRNDKAGEFGNSLVVWIFLLSLVLFTSTVWMQKADQATSAEAIESIRSHLQEGSTNFDYENEEAFFRERLEWISNSNERSSFIMVGMFALAMGMMISNYNFMRRRKEDTDRALSAARETAFTDPLTGVKSKNAFVEHEYRIDARLAEGSIDSFAVIVCDVNGLKYINDTYGHAAGDDYIKAACAIVCRHFKRSPVFRIGGDEFVVIPAGEDLENRESIMKQFDMEIEGNLGTTNAVISAGVSIFIPDRDRSFHDVFERADARMYQRKMQLKSMGARTRD